VDRFPLLFRALADPTRLRILAVLDGGATCVGDLAGTLGSPQSTTSRHLAYLRRAGLVETRQEGPWSFYSLARADGRVDRELRRCLRACVAESEALQADAARAARLREASGCCPSPARRSQ
jgi:ArsR family transcriptional regulator